MKWWEGEPKNSQDKLPKSDWSSYLKLAFDHYSNTNKSYIYILVFIQKRDKFSSFLIKVLFKDESQKQSTKKGIEPFPRSHILLKKYCYFPIINV